MARTGVGSQTGGGGGGTIDIGKMPVDPNRPSQLSPQFYKDYINHRLNQIRSQGVKAGPVPAAQSPLLSEPQLPYAQPAAPSPEVARRVDAMGRGLSMGDDDAFFGNLQQYIPDLNHTISRSQRLNYEPSPEHQQFQDNVEQALDIPVVPMSRVEEQLGTKLFQDVTGELSAREDGDPLKYSGGDLTPRQYIHLMPTLMKQQMEFLMDPDEIDAAKQSVDDSIEGFEQAVIDGLKAKDGMTASSLQDGGTPAQKLVAFSTRNLIGSLESGEYDGDYADPSSMSIADRNRAGLGELDLATEGARKNAQRKVIGDLFRTFQDGELAVDYANWFPTAVAAMNYMDGEQIAVDRMQGIMDSNVFRGRADLANKKLQRGGGLTGGPSKLFQDGRPTTGDDYTFDQLVQYTHGPEYPAGRYFGDPGGNALQTLGGLLRPLDARNQSSYMYNRPNPLHYNQDTQETAANKVLRANQMYKLGPERFTSYAVPAAYEAVTGKPQFGMNGLNFLAGLPYAFGSNPWSAASLGAGVGANVAGKAGTLATIAELAKEAPQELAENIAEGAASTGSISGVLSDLVSEKQNSPFVATPTKNIYTGNEERALAPYGMSDNYWDNYKKADDFWEGIYQEQDRDYKEAYPPAPQRKMNTGIQKYR